MVVTHTFHITGKFTSVPAFPWAGGIVPSFPRKHIVSCQGICAGKGVLCPIRAELAFYLQKISAKTGLALPSGELADNMESIKFWWEQQLASIWKALSILWKSLVFLFSLGRWEQPPKVICMTEEDVPRLWGSIAQPTGVGCPGQHCVPDKITAPGTTRD